MGKFGSYYKGEKKKRKKSAIEKKAEKLARKKHFVLPKVSVIPKGKKTR